MVESKTAFTWTEKEGIWCRKLGSMESFYLAMATPEGQPVHWMVACCVDIAYHGPDMANTENSLRQAWRTVSRDLSSVAVVADPASQELVFDKEFAEKDWLQKSFQVRDHTSADELLSELKSQFHITLHFLRRTNQLVIQAPHTLIDGRGILYLYDALFKALSGQVPQQPGTGPEAGSPNLAKPYDEWLGMSTSPSEKNFKDAQVLFHRVLQQKKPIQLPGIDFAAPPGKSVHKDLALTQETTTAIVKACKQQGISVTSALHAALARATQVSGLESIRGPKHPHANMPHFLLQKIQLAAGEEGTTYVSVTTIDLRRYFPTAFVPHQHSIGSLECGIPFAADLSSDETFETLSKSLHDQYKAPFAFANNDFNFLTPLTSATTQMLAKGDVPPSSTPSVSSMGIVDRVLQSRYGYWEIKDFWVTSTMLTGDFQMYFWTFRDRIKFSACYNEAFYEIEKVEQILDSTRHEVLRGLGLV